MDILLIGGTRFVGHHLAETLLERGHAVTTFNRGRTPDELPANVERLHGDRTDPAALHRALGGKDFDAAVDTIAMRGTDTAAAVQVLDGRVGHYVHFSTGQVYLVRDGCPTPAREDDYAGPLVPAPPGGSWEEPEWRYGMDKRECEDRLEEAWASSGFPATRLRLPMIHGTRDPRGRVRGYVLRALDGGPLLVPVEPGPPIRHVHQADVVAAVARIVEEGLGIGAAFNLAPAGSWRFERFLDVVCEELDAEPEIVRMARTELERARLFPACSPLSSPWMSLLDGGRAHAELGLAPRELEDWLPGLIRRLREVEAPPPASYATQREDERELATSLA